ncbi:MULTISPECIES: hypothetical protein [Synechocystis]|uniref:Uncharacterized protein n=1 Tax=Synechocystis salina LEGE 00031 TaxID=1828736 RepID=A0ABR9VM04_9SYNC|nr:MULTISPECIES: hypothetical protein [Synechocystis]MBD2652193.1 hypothetical protein [Synechocystis sp. FACHB-383]MBE9196763.1 hypothetical protein [Synechocystis sp. LEGE 06083]MBE9239452.1 hypothetical protein [Synechocystis salina LEGE 00041]MBE9252376.1 hypothetical protein [Synechocystis salina LEGE 00031]
MTVTVDGLRGRHLLTIILSHGLPLPRDCQHQRSLALDFWRSPVAI